jgi:uncharacterized protein YciI
MPAPRHFLYLIKPSRATFVDDMTPQEEEVMAEHFGYLKRLLAEGRLVFAGPCLDGAFGVVVLEVEAEETAFQLMMEDPSVRAGVMAPELHPFRLSLPRRQPTAGSQQVAE